MAAPGPAQVGSAWDEELDLNSDFYGDLARRHRDDGASGRAESWGRGGEASDPGRLTPREGRPIQVQAVVPRNRIPWSALWWPRRHCELSFLKLSQGMSPLEKYDTLVMARTGRNPQAALWEADPVFGHNYAPNQDQVDWAGHCNGAAVASMLVREPPPRFTVDLGAGAQAARLKIPSAAQATPGVARHGDSAYRLEALPGGRLELTGDDVKGWLAELFMICSTMQFRSGPDGRRVTGERYNRREIDVADPNFQDIHPHYFHWLMLEFVQRRGQPVIVEVDPHAPVNNHPAYAFQAQGTEYPGVVRFQSRVWLADYAPTYQFQGTKPMVKDYTYDLQTDAQGRVTGGRWTGRSVTQHPDFCWVPTGDRRDYTGRENPRVEPEQVWEALRGAWN